MKKIIGGIAFLVLVSIVAASCSKSETYADKLKKERKAINRLIDNNGFKIIYTYPKDGVFKENEFFHDSNSGIYLHVVDSGNGTRASKEHRTGVLVRYKNTIRPMYSDTVFYQNTGQSVSETNDWIDFNYNQTTSYISYYESAGYSNYFFKSPGMVAPLEYVGDGAIVKLIVPFDSGSGFQASYYEPVYFGYLKYIFSER